MGGAELTGGAGAAREKFASGMPGSGVRAIAGCAGGAGVLGGGAL